jgi:transcriptional regulator GlxA family with amidase domain
VVDDGAVITAGGVTSGVDLALWLVERGRAADAARTQERGLYEVRTRQGRTLYRLLCLLEQASSALDGPSIVCLDGLSKRDGSAALRPS